MLDGIYVPITFQALFAPDRRALQFAIKTFDRRRSGAAKHH